VASKAELPSLTKATAVNRAGDLALGPTRAQPPVARAASPLAPEQTQTQTRASEPTNVRAALPAAPAAKESRVGRSLAKSLAAGPGRSPALAGRPAKGDFRVSADGIIYSLAVEINGTSFGRAPVLVGNDNRLAIKLGDILALLEPAMDHATYERLSSSKDADTFVSFDRIRAAGIDIRYDTVHDRLILGS
jgi:hypothetical protein